MARSQPITSAVRGRCGTCGEGKLFKSYLKLKDRCDVCGQDFTVADTADGPAFFVGFFVLIISAPLLFLIPLANIPVAMKAAAILTTVAMAVVLTVVLLPIAKGIFFNLQIHHDSGQRKH